MTLKGKKFAADDLPSGVRRALSRKTGALEARLAEQTERYRIVATAKDGTPYIAEELQERALRTLSPQVRVLATMACLQLTPVERHELVSAFDAQGELIIPFDRV